MNLKSGVRLLGIRPELLVAMIVAKGVFEIAGFPFTITSVVDSAHGKGSLHFKGLAFDCRTVVAGINDTQAQKIRNDMSEALGAEFDVVLEKDHIHVEWDPDR